MRSWRNIQITLCSVLGMLSLFGLAQAKWFPYVEGEDDWGDLSNAHPISDATGFSAFYGSLESNEDVDALMYTFDQPVAHWTVEIQIPVCGDAFESFSPSVAVVGSGLPRLPFVASDTGGAVIFAEALVETARPVDEHMGVYEYTQFTVDIPQAGEYVVVVWEPNGQSGAYTLVTGADEPSFAGREAEAEEAFAQIENGEWMGLDCDTP